jgi:poly(3-hydroxybutyrate) depolymerase
MAGHATGGMMAYQMAGLFSDQVASVGLVAAAAGANTESGIATVKPPGSPLSMVAFYGALDETLPIKKVKKGNKPVNISAAESRSFFAEVQQCSGDPETKTPKKKNLTKYIYGNCAGGTQQTYYFMENVGHSWGDSAGSINPLLWDFFSNHHKPIQ